MTYCSKCGNQNPEGAEFCNRCGAPLGARPIHYDKDWDKRCEDECAGGKKGASIFWGIVVILIGLAVIFWVLDESNVELPTWLQDINFGLILGIVIAIALIVTGITIIVKRSKS